MDKEIISKSNEETKQIAKSFAKTLKVGDIVLLNGTLGAGKTVFVKGVVEYFSGGKEIATSPTFVIVNEYKTNPPIYHFDLYRIKSIDELFAIGVEEYLYSNGICFIEWPERAEELFSENVIRVKIDKINDDERLIKISRWVMNSLIIDCSSGMSLFVLRGNDVFSYVNYEIKKHTDELLLKLDELLKQAELKINEIDNLCVCVGPGSFTGIRVAISIIKGIAVSGKFKIFTLSNFDIYDTKTTNFGVLVLEGFSNNVYVRIFDNELIIDKCVSVQELVAFIKDKGDNFEVFVQNEKTQNLLKKYEINSKIAQINTIFAFNEKISNNKNILLEQISPIYLRASQAEIERQKRISNDE